MGLFDRLFGGAKAGAPANQPGQAGAPVQAQPGAGAPSHPAAPASPQANPAAYNPALVRPWPVGADGRPPIFERFQPVKPMPEASLQRYAAAVPPAVVEMWQTYGQGFVGDGYLRLIDPDTISPDGVLNPDEGAVALFNTALDDTIFWHGPVKAFICAKWRQGVLDLVSLNNPADPREVLRSFGDPAFQDRALEKRHFVEWLARGGAVPDLTRGLFHVPAPALGGPFLSATLEEGGALESQAIYLQLGGGPQVRHENPDDITPRADYGTPPQR